MQTKGFAPKGIALLASLLIALGGCASNSQHESAGQFVDDSVITTKIKSAFVADKEVSALNIAVETDRGNVRLTGNAKSNHEAQQAERIARSIQGVRSVRNDIALR